MTAEEIQRLREARKKLKAGYTERFLEISAILFRHDPIGINFEGNTDEYDPEAGTILPRLHLDLSADEVTGIVHEEFVRWFGRDTAGSKERYAAIAAEIRGG